jgi:hypothetical protein
MRIFSAVVLVVALLVPNLVESATGESGLTVTFVDSDHFRDAAFDRQRQTDPAVLDGIRKHLEKLGTQYLAPGQQLDVQILDIDLAGRLEPWRSFDHGVRYMRDITWPRIKLHYVLERNGADRIENEETLTDLSYLSHVVGPYFSSDRLRYEKQMLDVWFKARFVDHRAIN